MISLLETSICLFPTFLCTLIKPLIRYIPKIIRKVFHLTPPPPSHANHIYT